MTHLNNLKRDALWVRDLGQTGESYSSSATASAATYNSDGVVYQATGFAFVRDLSGTISAGQKGMFGVHIQAPDDEYDEAQAYRVRAYLPGGPSVRGVFIGRNDGTITGSGDGMNHWKAFPVGDNLQFDEVVMVDPVANDNALVFGIYVGPGTSVDITGIISVQRLATATPAFGAVNY